MKVLFTFSGLPHYYNFVLNKLNKINNLEVAVVIPDGDNKGLGKGVYQSESDIQFKVFKLPAYKTFYKKMFFKNFKSVIEKFKPDCIVMVWPYNLALLFYPMLYFYLKKKNIKLIYKDIPFLLPKFIDGLTSRNIVMLNEDLTPFKLTIKKRIYFFVFTLIRYFYYKLFDAHVNYVEDAFDILPTYGVKKESIFITYNSPDTERLEIAKIKAQSLSNILPAANNRIIHVGRLVKWKKVDLLINAVSILREKFPDIELIVIGKGPEENNLKMLTEKLGLTDKVKFIGAIYEPEILGRYLIESDLYVIAGMGGLSINEAMLFEKPIICSICDGTEKKLVKDGYNGYFFENDNLSDLVSKIELVLKDKEKAKLMGQNSYNIIKTEININTVLLGYINAFNYISKNKFNLTL
jgi:glycosyltransferase involved in cell wall biosynthesis